MEYVFVETKTGRLFMKITPNKEIKGDVSRIGEWLKDDVMDGYDVIAKVKEILDSSEPNEELFWGNGFKTFVNRKFSTIRFNWEEECPEIKPCTLPTQMLYEILEIWIKAYKEHSEKSSGE